MKTGSQKSVDNNEKTNKLTALLSSYFQNTFPKISSKRMFLYEKQKQKTKQKKTKQKTCSWALGSPSLE